MKSLASRNPILRENHDAVAASSTPKSKSNNRKPKPRKENAPPPQAPDPFSFTAVKMKSPLPPRPPLKRKLSVESDTCSVAANSADSGVKVMVRIRPPNNDEEDGVNAIQKITEDSLTISGHTFTFDAVADVQSKQSDIFEHVGTPLVENCLSGFNSSVFAYGQTGSGKTYTIWGANNALLDEEQRGLAPRVFQRLFERIDEEQLKQVDRQMLFTCRCSFLEIYNEQITDLLDPSTNNLQLREDVRNGVYVESLRTESVSSMKHVLQLLVKGLSNRRTSATSVNAESSRSHSVFTCVVESRFKSPTDGLMHVKMSKINFVDLAGSERQKQTGASGERLKEAGNINRSLSQLGNLINILAEVSQAGKQRHIPYRDSKLTFLLQESLGGNAKLAMICAISPSQSCMSETLSTLRFAQRAKSIKNRAVINEEMKDDVNILREVIRQLRDELQIMKANSKQPNQSGAYATACSARRSLSLLRFSLSQPTVLPHVEDDSDEEMEIVDNSEAVPSISEETCAFSSEQARQDEVVNMDDEASEIDEPQDASGGKLNTKLISHEVKPGIAIDNSLPGEVDNSEFVSKMGAETGNEELSKVSTEECPSTPIFSDMATHKENANCCNKTTVADVGVGVVPTDDSSVLTSPTPSKSPRPGTNIKSPRNSSRTSPSQSVQSQEMTILKPSKSTCLKSLSDQNSCFTSNEHLAAALNRGLEIIKSQHLSPPTKRSSFRLNSTPTEFKTVVPIVKVDVAVQACFEDHESLFEDAGRSLCIKCKTEKFQKELQNDDGNDFQNVQSVPVNKSSFSEKCKQVPKAVEKVLAGAIRREMALEELCSKQNVEIIQLNRLVQQYNEERECDEKILQTHGDKIASLHSLTNGIMPTNDFLEEKIASLTHEHKILLEKYENHPDVTRTKNELKRVQDELENYQNFFDLGERDVLLEEIQDLRNQLQFYLDSSAKTSRRQAPLVQPTSSCEGGIALVSGAPILTESTEKRLEQERIQWTEAEAKWISLVEELRTELEESRYIVKKQKQDLDLEKKCSEDLQEAMTMAMEAHARMLEQYADLEEKHMELLVKHRKIQDGIDDVKKAASRAGIKGAELKFINKLAAEISALKMEREKERRYFRDENKGLKEQLRDTAEAVEAAGELLVRLKEAEEALAAEQRRAKVAEQKMEIAYREIEKLNKLLPSQHVHREVEESNGAAAWQEEFTPSYDIEEESPSWFYGYDRCNI